MSEQEEEKDMSDAGREHAERRAAQAAAARKVRDRSKFYRADKSWKKEV